MSYKKTLIFVIAVSIIFIGLDVTYIILDKKNSNGGDNPKIVDPSKKLPKLPKPEVTGGERGKLGIDKNINESTIDKYLGREDSVYRDMRMLKDPGNYEAIGGDSKLTGFIKGFEIVPYPYLVNVTNLPKEVGKTYEGPTLFTLKDGKYTPNYKESIDIINYLFPKDKKIFLICGGGGYAGMTKSLLVSLGYNKDNIYNIGGYWYYNGKNNIEVKREISKKKVVYDNYKVLYHNIDFTTLTKVKNEK
jgi:rhodanese-related sulfurtransferase